MNYMITRGSILQRSYQRQKSPTDIIFSDFNTDQKTISLDYPVQDVTL